MNANKCPVSPTEAAKILNISRPQVLLLIQSGVLPGAKISPRIIRIKRADVLNLLLDNRVMVAPLVTALASVLPSIYDETMAGMVRALKHISVIDNATEPDTFLYLLDRALAELRALPQSMTLRILIEQAEALRAQLCN